MRRGLIGWGSMAAVAISILWMSRPLEAAAPQPLVIEEHGVKMRGDGKDENVRSTSLLNDLKKRPPAPPGKSASKDRGDARHCDIHVDNHTPWKIQVFIDGDFDGLVPAWGDTTTGSVVGATRVYAKAEFATTPTTSWGPKYMECDPSRTVTWRLSE